MSREQRSSIAIAVAVFLSGARPARTRDRASRVLAPYFGNSLFVWGALIGVVLAGPLDRLLARRRARRPAAAAAPARRPCSALGALLVLAIPFVDERVLERVVDWDPGPRLEPAPRRDRSSSARRASSSPRSRRSPSGCCAARSSTSGRTAGRLFAISTAGSIVGTFATAFWLIPSSAPTSCSRPPRSRCCSPRPRSSRSSSGCRSPSAPRVALAGARRAPSSRSPPSRAATLSRVAAARTGRRSTASETRRREPTAVDDAQTGFESSTRKDTQYHRLAVVDDDTSRATCASTARSRAACIWTTRSRRGSSTPTTSTSGSPTSRARSGCSSSGSAAARRRSGCGATSRACRSTWSSSTRTSWTSPYRYFALPRDPRLHVEVEDGRRFLAGDDERWDVIVVDAFYSDSIPFHLATLEFLELVRSRLEPGGVVVVERDRRAHGRRLAAASARSTRTYRVGLPDRARPPGRSTATRRRRTTSATSSSSRPDGAAPSKAFLRERWERASRPHRPARPTSAGDPRPLGREPVLDAPTSPLLTDDYAPTDALLLARRCRRQV